MHVIAWLLTQRAVAAGELSRDQAGEAERRLGEAPATDRDLFPRLPEAAAELVRASEELYDRVEPDRLGPFRRGAGAAARRAACCRRARTRLASGTASRDAR